MDQIFNRLGRLLKSMFHDDNDTHSETYSDKYSYNQDINNAMDELDDFLEKPVNSSNHYSYTKTDSSYKRQASETLPPEELRRDYANLEVSFGASFSDVIKSYKNQLRAYHPDKHTADSENLDTATEITKKLNESYLRIKKYNEKHKS